MKRQLYNFEAISILFAWGFLPSPAYKPKAVLMGDTLPESGGRADRPAKSVIRLRYSKSASFRF